MDNERPHPHLKLATSDGATRAEILDAEQRQAQAEKAARLKATRKRRRLATHVKPADRKVPPPWKPTHKERHTVGLCIAAGMNATQAAEVVGRSPNQVLKHCRREIDAGGLIANSRVVRKLYEKCMKGDTIAMLFWCKTRLGWQEKNRIEHTGAAGGPIQHETVEAEANAFTQKILTMAQRFEEAPPSNDTEAAPAQPEAQTVNSEGP